MPTFIEEESRHPSLSPSLHLMLFKLFGVASDQLRSVMVSSWEGREETCHTEPKGMARSHGASSAPCFLAQMHEFSLVKQMWGIQ